MQRDLILISEMIEAAEQARSLVDDTSVDALESDRQRRDALLWNFTVLGEAAGELGDAIKQRWPEVPWSRPTQLRDRVVHGYWSIDLQVLHTTATDVLPGFVEQLRSVLRRLEAEDADPTPS
jgi:uncharacterized protein with HEPN domain